MRKHDENNELSRRRLASAVEAWRANGPPPNASALLAHLAWWDRYYASRWTVRLAGDATAHEGFGSSRTDALNEAGAAMWSALAFDDAAGICLDAAARVDEIVAGLSDALIQETESRGAHRLLERAMHRNEHLSEMAAEA